MKRQRKKLIGVASIILILLSIAAYTSTRSQFIVGGALVNMGYRLQDTLHAYDFEHGEDITPDQVWNEFRTQNTLAATVRHTFPRSTYHPLVAMLVCMDARIDTSELAGDTRRNYYIVRTAGSVLSPKEEEMLELAVINGVKVLILTRHTDCAAETAAADPVQRARFPALVTAVDERDRRVTEFLSRPEIAGRIASGKLIVKQLLVDTKDEHLSELSAHAAHPVNAAKATQGKATSH